MLERYIQEVTAGNENAKLEVSHFNTVMDAWAKTSRADAPEKVKQLLQQMKDLRENHTLSKLRPNVVSFSILISAWSRSRSQDAAKNALLILKYMEDNHLRPNSKTYNAVQNALVHSANPEKAIMVEELIERMQERHKAGFTECRPDVCTYQSLIAAWSRTPLAGTPQKAEEVLQTIDKLAVEEGNSHLTPNRHCYTAAIHAWSNSLENNKARRAYQIFHMMRKRWMETNNNEVKPNVVACTAVINACANPNQDSERESALQIAKLMLEEMRYCSFGMPNFLTYSAYLRVIATTMEEGRERDLLVRRTFEQCCKDGQVGNIVLDKLKLASTSLYEELELSKKISSLPPEWNRNVKGERCKPENVPAQKADIPVKSFSKLAEVRERSGLPGPYSQDASERDVNIEWKNERFNGKRR